MIGMGHPLERLTDQELHDLLRETRDARNFAGPRWLTSSRQLADLEQALRDERRRRDRGKAGRS